MFLCRAERLFNRAPFCFLICVIPEGYERLAQAKGEGTSMSAVQGAASSDNGTAAGSPNLNGSTTEIPSKDGDAFDMFADDEEHAPANLSSDGGNLATVSDAPDRSSESKLYSLEVDYMK